MSCMLFYVGPGERMKAVVTGAGGLVGSACVRELAHSGCEVVGVDNDMRSWFFGKQGTTHPVLAELERTVPGIRNFALDIRDRQGVRDLFEKERPNFIIHTAAQPSHDKAASIPYEDFDTDAVGTLNLLVAARDFCHDSPFCFTSTNKVYGDRPSVLPLVELEKRFDYTNGLDGIDESMSIDACLLSLFGASKVAADVLCQEFGHICYISSLNKLHSHFPEWKMEHPVSAIMEEIANRRSQCAAAEART